MAELIARKSKAVQAINGGGSGADGLAALLGDDGDLQSMLIESVKKGVGVLEGSAEDWIAQTSDRARELLENIGKPKTIQRRLEQKEQAEQVIKETVQPLEEIEDIEDISEDDAADLVSLFAIQEEVSKIVTVAELTEKQASKKAKGTGKKRSSKKAAVSQDQLAFDLFAM